jgi:hypothetical protein
MATRLFHYTIGARLPRIVSDGVLKPSRPYPGTQLGALWLSANPLWEGSVAKSIIRNGQRRVLDKAEIAALGQGLLRFEVKIGDHICVWPDFIVLSGIDVAGVRQLEDSGRRRGADPADWYGALRPIPRSEWLELSQWDDELNTWQPIEL